ncbi:DL-glycerol-3-phosphatase [Friedmanniomyces endolithicus]|uniref:DL-glycerol-3-phosphatase n=1 Tax=Friedmanniomyces endolithicus TaxID=329885 RepID=A0AAN6J610_9PEZI|nr:DL-glycerol-3-phosphatase [Friedmanniomyces endolithicus]KAK0307727.1 DL-glycerol-3-phosphatase [Friedmanniomyces endolithicus]KAK0926072.1 DL-glycerol-3-phosphatase [Friedmanniomyces endolithicus]KAK0965688.1 DL-glycerol-3-phosphatase [Friedmanniomyces endolithicus]KAK0977799.1 DL-glycerol-3-phosphatase [Friedmanniomyces endolithicus]
MSSILTEEASPSHSSSHPSTAATMKAPPLNPPPTASQTPQPNFSAPPSIHSFAALLFDMDGTLIDSTSAITHHWHALGTLIGVPGPTILETSHGRRTIDVLALLAPQYANWDFVCEAEARVPRDYGGEAVEVPGARGLLRAVGGAGVPWAIVTSGTRGLVEGWLSVMGMERPGVLVCAEEVGEGKPSPEGYRLGARRLMFGDGSARVEVNGDGGDGALPEVTPEEILVLEDAPAGVRAGKAAGYRVVALATSHTIEQLREAGADWIVEDMRSVTMTGWDAKARRVGIQIKNALVS